MTVDVKGFRAAHDEIGAHAARLRVMARVLPLLDRAEREALRQEIVRELHDEIAPHMKLDEQLLFPEVAARLGDPLVACSMNYDHLAIRHWIEHVEQTDAADAEYLQQLLYGLDALIRVHVWKENELFLRPLTTSWPPDASEALEDCLEPGARRARRAGTRIADHAAFETSS